MKRALLVGQVASLARDIEVSKLNLADFGFHVNTSDDPSVSGSIASPDDENNDKGGILDGIDFCSRSARINELLGDWEVRVIIIIVIDIHVILRGLPAMC